MLSIVMRFVAFYILLGLVFLQFARIEMLEPSDLNEQVLKHYQRGEYVKAATIAERVLGMAEKKFGPDHPNVGVSLFNLSVLYHPLGSRGEANQLLDGAIAIFDKALKSGNPKLDITFRMVDAPPPKQAHAKEDSPQSEPKSAMSKTARDRHHLEITEASQRADKSLARHLALVQRNRVAADTSEKSSQLVALSASVILSKQTPVQTAKITFPPVPARRPGKKKLVAQKSKRISRRRSFNLNRPSAIHLPQPVFITRPSVASP